jgi:excinuclease ABC subunit C
MRQAAERYDFETAASLRDRITDIHKTLESQSVAFGEDKNADVWAITAKSDLVQAAVLIVRSGVVIGCRPLAAEGGGEGLETNTSALLTQFYSENPSVPEEIILPEKLPASEASLLTEWLEGLRGSSMRLSYPKPGESQKLIDMALENAKAGLDERIERLTKTRGSMVEICAKLNLPYIPRRIECLDIAHLQGFSAAAGIVVVEDGEFKKSLYRKFRLKQTKPGDDYAAMKEIVSRRFRTERDKPWPKPDLFIIDGGRGHLMIVSGAFKELGLTAPPLAAVAKDRQGGGPDRVFIPGRKNPVDLKPASAALALISKMRDEAHRFCRTYHHWLRSKEMTASLFEGLKGLGHQGLKKLQIKFPTLYELKAAKDEDLRKVVRLSPENIQKLRQNIEKLLEAQGLKLRAPEPINPNWLQFKLKEETEVEG